MLFMVFCYIDCLGELGFLFQRKGKVMDFWMLTAFINRKFLVFLHFPEVPLIIFTRKFMKLGNNSITTVYLGHVLAFR